LENPYKQKEVEPIIENPHNEEAIDFSVLTANTKLNFNGFDSKVRVDDIQDFLNSIGKFAKLELFYQTKYEHKGIHLIPKSLLLSKMSTTLLRL